MTRSTFCILGLGALLALASPATAQGRHVFAIDSSLSSWTPTGQLGLGGATPTALAVTPSPFNVSGEVALDITVVGSTMTAGQMVRGDALISVPTLTATHAATGWSLSVANVELFFVSTDMSGTPGSFAIDGAGGFNTHVVAELTQGTATFTVPTPIGPIPIPVDLAGDTSPPHAISGSIVPTAVGSRIQVSVNTPIGYTQPAQPPFIPAVELELNLNGTAVANDLVWVDTNEISTPTGGTQTLTVSAGAARAGQIYILAGSATGTSPGWRLRGMTIPLTPDSYTALTIFNPTTFFGTTSIGTLDGQGMATATFTWPPFPFFELPLHHAFFTINGTATSVLFVSNPVPLTLKM